MQLDSIRKFLIIGLLSIMTVAHVVIMAWSYHETYLEAEELQDAQLAQYSRALSLMFVGNLNPDHPITIPIQTAPEDWQGDAAGTLGHKYEGKLFFKILTADRQILAHSENTPDFLDAPLKSGFQNFTTDGHNWRIFTLRIPSKNSWIITAQRGDIRSEMGGIIALKNILPFLFTLPILFLLTGWLVSRGLKPITVLSHELERRQANDLHPIPINHPVQELLPLISSTNQLLKRLSDAFTRERRFVGYAAHELRTPLAGIGVHLQNASHKSGLEKENAIALSLKGHRRMVHLVEQLLALARTTPDAYFAHFQKTNLYTVCQKVIAEHIQLFLHKSQKITLNGDESMSINGDAAWLEIMISNLIRNASLYTPEEGVIALTVRQCMNHVVLDVEDSGPGIPEVLRQKVFDRFYRVDSDRHASGVEGAGLGLSIVAHIVELHDASITLGTSQLSGLKVTVSFP
ncbi:ATP-binding protein [Endozoicomonas ascidiicola]|uniref:ATP-binding protein n=1 Tax=Endozoicomonas ascidiicola TaxID=1698521 RepID=UPI000837353D|nr:ATP-binding protein [Endozoicomonas ascidiicola]